MWIFNNYINDSHIRDSISHYESNSRLLRGDYTSGFSLIEAMVATAITGIAIVGVYSLIIYSNINAREAVMTGKMQLQAEQILEIIESDIANINSYNNMDLTINCVAPATADTASIRRYEWCRRLDGEIGTAMAGDSRLITVTVQADGSNLVEVLMEYNLAGGGVQVLVKRKYN